MLKTILAIVGAVCGIALIVLGYKNRENVSKVYAESEFKLQLVGDKAVHGAIWNAIKTAFTMTWFVIKVTGKLIIAVVRVALSVSFSGKKEEVKEKVVEVVNVKKDVVTV